MPNLTLQNRQQKTHCMQLPDLSIKLLLKMISLWSKKSIHVNMQLKKIRNIKRDCKNFLIEILSFPNIDVLGSSSTLLQLNH